MANTTPAGIYYRTNAEANSTSEAQSLALATSVDAATGLVPVTPTSVVVSGGSASTSSSGEVTFTGVTSVALNGVFSSKFRNYRIIYVVTGAFTQTQNYRFRTGGTDNSSASYYFNEMYANAGTVGASGFNNGATGRVGYSEANYRSTHIMDVINPFATQPTEHIAFFGKVVSPTICMTIGGFNATTSFDGINFYLGAGANGSTGTLMVYGYR